LYAIPYENSNNYRVIFANNDNNLYFLYEFRNFQQQQGAEYANKSPTKKSMHHKYAMHGHNFF